MTVADIQYERLPGRGIGVGESSRLYLAKDHLLLVTATGFSESYRRFALKDIRAITARKTASGAMANGVLGFLSFWVFIAALYALETGPVLALSIAAGILLALLLVNLVRGPTYLCEIHTAVQSRRMSSVNRLRTVKRLMTHLAPHIATVQAPMSEEQLRQKLDQLARPGGLQGGGTDAVPPVIR